MVFGRKKKVKEIKLPEISPELKKLLRSSSYGTHTGDEFLKAMTTADRDGIKFGETGPMGPIIAESTREVLGDATKTFTVTPEKYADILQRFIDGKITNNQARAELGYGPLEVNKRAKILQTAENLINGDRAQTYGPPEISFGRIADIWIAQGFRLLTPRPDMPDIFQAKEITPTDVALALIGMKLSRTMGAKKHEDNWIDLAGYAGLGAELIQGE